MVIYYLNSNFSSDELFMVIEPLLNSTVPHGLLKSVDGSDFLLDSLKGRPFVLYFYPKDNTSGCTTQACDLRDNLAAFTEQGIAVFGVSKDNAASHKRFSDKYTLNFPLLIDESGVLCDAFGVWKQKSMYGKVYFGIERSTFYVDDSFTIRHIWRKVKIPNHWNDVLKIINLL